MAGHAKDPADRERKRAAAVAEGRSRGPGKGPGAPPVQRGNDLAVRHGAYSPAVVNPRAAARLAGWLEDPGFLDHAKVYSWRLALEDLAFTTVQIELLRELTADEGVEGSISELVDTEDHEDYEAADERSGSKHRTSHTKRRSTPLENLRRMQVHQLNLLRELGLTPASYAKLGLDVARTTSITELWGSQ